MCWRLPMNLLICACRPATIWKRRKVTWRVIIAFASTTNGEFYSVGKMAAQTTLLLKIIINWFSLLEVNDAS